MKDMKMKQLSIIVFGLCVYFLMSSVSGATLNLTSNPVELTVYNNTGTNITMLNLTINLTGVESVLVRNIIATFNSTNETLNGSQTNLSICIYNSTINSTNRLGCGTTWNVSNNLNQTNITLNFVVTNTTEENILIVYEVYRNVTTPVNISLYLQDNNSITLNNTNVTVNGTFPLISNFTQVQDLHASASISPHYVDTNVKNQTLSYLINITGREIIENVTINVPDGYVITKVLSHTWEGGTINNCTSGCSYSENQINITENISSYLRVNFTVNTSSSSVNSTAFNSTISGGNLTSIETDVTNSSTNVTTKQLINVTNVSIMKNTAIVNGTDYWQFNFTLNITANVSGLIQFKMNPWNSTSANTTINLTNGTGVNKTYYASMWLSGNTSNVFNVTNEYNITQGISLTATAYNTYVVILKMIIPSGTPIASDWWTTYYMLFRSLP